MEAEDTPAASAAASTPRDEDLPCITALNCSRNRTVFTEDNTDGGWISTDTTVDVER